MNWPIKNQGNRGTCTAFGVTAVREWRVVEESAPPLDPPVLSEQYLFWAAKVHDAAGGEIQPGGTFLQSAALVMGNRGTCRNDLWPYAIDPPVCDHCPVTHAGRPHLTPPPDEDAHNDATGRQRVMVYVSTPTAEDVRKALDTHGPVAVSLPVYGSKPKRQPNGDLWFGNQPRTEGILSEISGWQPAAKKPGHVVCVIGTAPSSTARGGLYFLFRNSWNPTLWASEPPPLETGASVPPGYGRVSWDFINRFTRSMAHLKEPSAFRQKPAFAASSA